MDAPFGDRRLELEYPCPWSYRVIGRDESRMRAAVLELVGEVEHSLTRSNTSRTGKYCSLALEITVKDEEHRLGLFAALSKHPDIRFVL